MTGPAGCLSKSTSRVLRKPFVNGPAGGTGEEKVTAFDNYIAYYGTYTLDLKAQTVTHHLQDASPPNWRGVNNVRWFEFQGNDRLLLSPREDGKGGVIDRKNDVSSFSGSASNSQDKWGSGGPTRKHFSQIWTQPKTTGRSLHYPSLRSGSGSGRNDSFAGLTHRFGRIVDNSEVTRF